MPVFVALSALEKRRKAVTFTGPYYSAGLAVGERAITNDVSGLGMIFLASESARDLGENW